MNFVALVNRLPQEYTANFCDLASEGPDIIMNQLKSIYNSHSKIHIHKPFTPVLR